jgi:putative peptidoglycan lipid II flippase
MSFELKQQSASGSKTMKPKSMLRSGVQLSAISLGIAFVSFANQLLLAAFFGTTMEMSSYLIAYSVPAVITGVFTMLFSFSAIPVLVAAKTEIRYRSLLGGFAVTIAAASLLIALVLFISAPLTVTWVGATLPAAFIPNVILMARVLSVNAALNLIVAFFIALQNANNHYARPLMASALPYVGMLVLTILLGKSIGSRSVAYGMLAGTAIAAVVLGASSLKSIQWPSERLDFRPAIRFFKHSPLVCFAMLAFGAAPVIESFWAARIDPISVSYLGYSQRLVNVVASLVAFGPSAVLATSLSQAHTDSDDYGFRRNSGRALRMVVFVCTGIAVVVSVFRVPIIRVLLERHAFSSSSTAGVASLVPFIMVGAIALTSCIMLMKALYACHQIRAAALIGGLQVFLYFVAAGLLSAVIGVRGIALAFAFSWWAALIMIISVLWKGHVRDLMNETAAFLWRLGVAATLCMCLGWLMNAVLMHAKGAAPGSLAMRLWLAVAATSAAFGTLSIVMNIEEMNMMVKLFGAKFGLGARNEIRSASS